MGITIDNYPVFGGAADISGAYVYIRDIRTTKDNGTFSLNYIAFYEKDVFGVTQRLDTQGYYDSSSNEYGDAWLASYTHLKANLDNRGLTYVDS